MSVLPVIMWFILRLFCSERSYMSALSCRLASYKMLCRPRFQGSGGASVTCNILGRNICAGHDDVRLPSHLSVFQLGESSRAVEPGKSLASHDSLHRRSAPKGLKLLFQGSRIRMERLGVWVPWVIASITQVVGIKAALSRSLSPPDPLVLWQPVGNFRSPRCRTGRARFRRWDPLKSDIVASGENCVF
ncbi:hypothetical protein LX32DRAFT_90013 [Colletotrichum zoysiae]|uniref:Secreted protein n=1 Tax=Colletotrichum zoysiae TaxID=1216348 RepID=A0AAD9HT38_9PEZI|nr:hypothetical protein LX32DRAFT_90013 [Colletotrichum zoysiae]